MSLGDIALTVISGTMIGGALYDAFRTLFVPEGRGALNNFLASSGWRLTILIGERISAKYRHSLLGLVGPAIFGAILASWTVMLCGGFALIYLPHLTEEFRIGSGLPAEDQTGYIDALYFSFSALSSTGFGDISPKSDSLRIVTMAEGISGTVMIATGLSWLLSLYPAIGRLRATSESVAVLRRAGLDPLQSDPSLVRDRILMLADRILEVSRDLAKFPILYYFMGTRSEASLAHQIDAIVWMQERASRSDDAGVVLSTEILDGALASLRTTLRYRFLGRIEMEQDDILERFRQDHLVPPEQAAAGEG